jgi:hypothetical protein
MLEFIFVLLVREFNYLQVKYWHLCKSPVISNGRYFLQLQWLRLFLFILEIELHNMYTVTREIKVKTNTFVIFVFILRLYVCPQVYHSERHVKSRMSSASASWSGGPGLKIDSVTCYRDRFFITLCSPSVQMPPYYFKIGHDYFNSNLLFSDKRII